MTTIHSRAIASQVASQVMVTSQDVLCFVISRTVDMLYPHWKEPVNKKRQNATS